MYCKNCGAKLDKGILHCSRCGAARRAHVSSPQNIEITDDAEKRAVRYSRRSTLLFTLSIFVLIASILFSYSSLAERLINKIDLGDVFGNTSPTLPPYEGILPSASDVPPSATERPSPTFPAAGSLKPSPVPSSTPEPTKAPVDTAINEDVVPIEALCGFLLHGDATYAQAILPPEYIEHIIGSYGFVTAFMGGEEAVIAAVGNIAVNSIESAFGSIYELYYTVTDRSILTEQELSELCEGLSRYGIESMPTEARLLQIDMHIVSEKGEFDRTLRVHVIRIDGNWYLDPNDLNF